MAIQSGSSGAHTAPSAISRLAVSAARMKTTTTATTAAAAKKEKRSGDWEFSFGVTKWPSTFGRLPVWN